MALENGAETLNLVEFYQMQNLKERLKGKFSEVSSKLAGSGRSMDQVGCDCNEANSALQMKKMHPQGFQSALKAVFSRICDLGMVKQSTDALCQTTHI